MVMVRFNKKNNLYFFYYTILFTQHKYFKTLFQTSHSHVFEERTILDRRRCVSCLQETTQGASIRFVPVDSESIETHRVMGE